MSEYLDLPPRARAKKYRELADDARRMAALAGDRVLRESYAIIAERWEEMARDIERRLARDKEWQVD